MRIPLVLVALLGCGAPPQPPPPDPVATPRAVATPADVDASEELSAVPRQDFNRIVTELGVPIHWWTDGQAPGVLTPDEVTAFWTPWSPELDVWMGGGVFTPRFHELYEDVEHIYRHGHDDRALTSEERSRRRAVRRDLAAGRSTVLRTDLTGASEGERSFVAHMLDAALGIEQIYALQTGISGLESGIPSDDGASRSLLHRNQDVLCASPELESEINCRAVPDTPRSALGIYPESLQDEVGFCRWLESERPELMEPFAVVRRDEAGELVAVPYHEAWKTEMERVATALQAGASALGPDEAAMGAYLVAAARAFRDGSWFEADKAWAAMNSDNSRWYLRVGPDETYWEDCSRKAAFHLSLARIDPQSRVWRERLAPVRAEMETTAASLAGAPYVAREVDFELPDFIEVTLNAGDARSPLGATLAQTLPNWGPVAEQGGRTVVMTNLAEDADSAAARERQVRSLVCRDSMAPFFDGREAALLTNILHEGSHHLGPSFTYEVDGKDGDAIFGGALSSLVDQLKAQASSMFFADWLARQGTIDLQLAERAHAADLAWSFGHIAEGMYSRSGQPKLFPQVSAIVVGQMMDRGALRWQPDRVAANGEHIGCFSLDREHSSSALEGFAREVLGIKARGDRAAAEMLLLRYVDVEGDRAALWDKIGERWRREPKNSYVYAIEM